MEWDDLNYWRTGEWQVVQERLDDLDKAKTTYNPRRECLFNALDATHFDEVKAVILGQDPYPNPKFAMGLAFSVPKNVKDIPESLKNIFDEYESDLHYPRPKNGSLEPWTGRGVLLWNTTPSVLANHSGSHTDWCEWKPLTEEILSTLSEVHTGLVFMLWGKHAQSMSKYIDTTKHSIQSSAHPSPLSAKKGWFGSRPFTTANDLLVKKDKEPIDWRLD